MSFNALGRNFAVSDYISLHDCSKHVETEIWINLEHTPCPERACDHQWQFPVGRLALATKLQAKQLHQNFIEFPCPSGSTYGLCCRSVHVFSMSFFANWTRIILANKHQQALGYGKPMGCGTLYMACQAYQVYLEFGKHLDLCPHPS